MKFALTLALILGLVMAGVPVPPTPEGYLFKEAPNAKIRLDIYEDLLCGDCKNFDPPFKQFLSTTYEGQPITDFIEVYFHTYILPLHINAFTMSRLSPYIWDLHHNGTVNAAFNEWCFEHQLEFKGEDGDNMSQIDVMNKICHDTDGLFGYTEAECLDVLKSDSYVKTVTNEQKYGAWYRVYTTPGVFLNGVQVDSIPETAKAWTTFIKPFLK